MVDEKKSDPQWKPGSIPLNKSEKIKLTSSKALATGTSKFGEWFLWTIDVTDSTVSDKDTKEVKKNYTGPATFFPTEKLNRELLALTGGVKQGTVVEITVTPGESNGKLFKSYDVKLIAEGKVSPSATNINQHQYISDFEKSVNEGIIENEYEHFEFFGLQKPYSLSKEKLQELWKIHIENGKTPTI